MKSLDDYLIEKDCSIVGVDKDVKYQYLDEYRNQYNRILSTHKTEAVSNMINNIISHMESGTINNIDSLVVTELANIIFVNFGIVFLLEPIPFLVVSDVMAITDGHQEYKVSIDKVDWGLQITVVRYRMIITQCTVPFGSTMVKVYQPLEISRVINGTLDLRIEYLTLIGLNNVVSINLSKCNLRSLSLSETCLTDLIRLTELNLSECGLSGFGHVNILQCVNMKHLDLSSNVLTSYSLAYPQGLEYLNLSNNLIGDFNFPVSGLDNLLTLNLCNNGIHCIPFHMLKSLYSLKSLDLSFNNIRTILYHLPESLSNLNYLYMSNNLIEVLYLIEIVFLKNIQLLDLSHNKIVNIVSNNKMTLNVIRHLDLSSNNIKSIAQVTSRKLGKYIFCINLNNNPIPYEDAFNLPHSESHWLLTKLILSGREINPNGKEYLNRIKETHFDGS